MPKTIKDNQKDTTTATAQAEAKQKNTDLKSTNSKKSASGAPTIEEVLAGLLQDDPKVEVKIAWTEVKPAYERVLRQVAKTMKVDGFRPGKVPASVAEERVKPEYLAQEVTRIVLPEPMKKALSESKQKLETEPNVVITKMKRGEDWMYDIYLPQRTKIKLPEYKKFLQTKKKQVRAEIEKMQAEAAKKAKAEKRSAPPEMDAAQIKARATDEALMALLQEIKPKVSRTLAQRGAQSEYEKLANQLSQHRVTWNDFLKNTGMSEEALSQQFMLRAIENIQMEFILDALMEAEKVTVSEEEIMAKMAEVMPNVTAEDDKKRQLAEPSVRDYLELMAKRQKLAQWLLEL